MVLPPLCLLLLLLDLLNFASLVGFFGVICLFMEGRIVHLVVVYGFQGASTDPEKLRLTDKLLDAVLCELAVVASGQPCLVVGDLNIELDRIPCLLKGLMAGHWFDLQSSWASASGVDPLPTCCRTFGSGGGSRRDFILGCPHAVSA